MSPLDDAVPKAASAADVVDLSGVRQAMAKATTVPGPKPRRGPGRKAPAPGASEAARKTAAVILEVLSGLRGVADAAKALGVAPARYYHLEQRAVEGLITACEPKPVGRQPQPTAVTERQQKECLRLRQDLLRHQALLRSAQRALGVTASPVVSALGERPGPNGAVGKGGKRRGRKTPVVRALSIVRQLQGAGAPSPSAAVAAISAGDRSGG
jgi:hypothetical protein